jgi:uncharacterized membrane protein
MAGVLTALMLVLCLRVVGGQLAPAPRSWMAVGAAWGLALLSKASAVTVAPAVLLVPVLALGSRIARVVRAVAIVVGTAALLAGWYYARNWVYLGRPFIGGWEASSALPFWQAPGYRTAAEFLRFGRALRNPVYATTAGIWDGLYSTLWTDGLLSGIIPTGPPWNFTLMTASGVLALPLTVALLVGLATAWRRPTLLTAAAVLLVMVAAQLWMYARVPIYPMSKASYLLGATPCLAVLIAAGLEPLSRRAWSRTVVFALVFAWAATVLGSYVILPGGVPPQ